MNYAVQYNALQRRYESLIADLRQVVRLLRRRTNRAEAVRRALSLLESILDGALDSDMSDSDASDSDAMTAAGAADSLLSQAQLPQPSGPSVPVAFVGRSFRLEEADDSAT